MITDLTRRFTVDGFELAWDQWGSGDGPPLVLCHGFSGSSHDWALHIEGLAEQRRVVTIDHRGHGLSSNSGAVDDYTVAAIVGDVIAWIESELDAPVDLLGHSMGGMVAIRVAIRRPDLLRSLIMMDTSAWPLFEAGDPMADAAAAFFDSLTDGPWEPASFDSPEEAMIESSTPAEWRDVKDARNAAFDMCAARGIGRELFAHGIDDIDSALATVAMPVTVIAGEHDAPFVDHAPRLADAVADGELQIIAGAHHSPQLTHAGEWRAVLEAHLARVG